MPLIKTKIFFEIRRTHKEGSTPRGPSLAIWRSTPHGGGRPMAREAKEVDPWVVDLHRDLPWLESAMEFTSWPFPSITMIWTFFFQKIKNVEAYLHFWSLLERKEVEQGECKRWELKVREKEGDGKRDSKIFEQEKEKRFKLLLILGG